MDVEDAAGAFNELGCDAEIFFQFLRQTGGAWVVVSLRAVFDRYDHTQFLLCSRTAGGTRPYNKIVECRFSIVEFISANARREIGGPAFDFA